MGGCVSSRPEFPNSVHPNVFTVYPVTRPASADAIETSSISGTANIGGKNNAAGQLEVTASELILHRRGHEPVHWPLQYVRRYGYENHLFSFESGRRCESGPGIFTFRCRRAHELFLLVQANVQEARSPPPAQPQHAASMDNAVATLERGRSGSVPSQFRFPGGRAVVVQQAPHARTEGSLTPRTLNITSGASSAEEIQSGPPPPSRDLDGDLGVSDVQNQHDVSAANIFVEMVPALGSLQKVQPLSQQRQRLSSQASSSAASDHSWSSMEKNPQSNNRRRPVSFEFGLTPTPPSSQEGGDSSAFVSPRDEPPVASTASPNTPSSTAYYVNVDPTAPGTTPHQKPIYQNKLLTGLRRAPGRSQSLGSASSNFPGHHPHHFSDSTADDRYHVGGINVNDSRSESPSSSFSLKRIRGRTTDQSIVADIGNGPLDYVTIDVGRAGTATGLTSARGAWASSIPSSFHKRYHKRHSSHTGWISNGFSDSAASAQVVRERSLTSVAETGSNHLPQKLSDHERGNGFRHESATSTDPSALAPPPTAGASNYARIDCARTKALRETAAAAQLQRRSTSCSASSAEAVEPGGSSTTGRQRHRNGHLSFGRHKPKSGSVEH